MNNNDDPVLRRFLVMGGCSALLHVLIAAIILTMNTGVEKPAKAYRVEVKYLQAQTPKTEEAKPATPEQPELIKEIYKESESPPVVDLTAKTAQILPEETPESADIIEIPALPVIETPISPVENAIITPGGGLGSGADTEDGGGNSLFASGTGRGWGGDAFGDGWGGGGGSPGSGGGTGGGYGIGTGNSRGGTVADNGKTGEYYAGMAGITPPVYERTTQPSYPAASRKLGEQGEVLLKVLVLINGRVGQAEVKKSSGYAQLDEAALKTVVERWRFKPARKGRETIICWVDIPINFSLN